MTAPTVVVGAPRWLAPAAVLLAVGAAAVAWNYARAGAGRWRLRAACAALKAVGLAALAGGLVDPLLTGTRPKPGVNIFVLLADDSQSMRSRDPGADRPRADWAKALLAGPAGWRDKLGRDFDVRGYAFADRLRPTDRFDALTFDGTASGLNAALAGVADRFRGRPLAGVLLVSDGNATDAADPARTDLPPVYPVAPPAAGVAPDLAVRRLTVSQTNFEAAPVALQADVSADGFAGRPVVAVVTDEAGKEVGRQQATPTGDRDALGFRFQVRPANGGVAFYRVNVRLLSEADRPAGGPSAEPTLANNSRLAAVDRGGGPYRVLYVGGRPNWEFKYLRRAADDDGELQLVGLIRVAKRQPKFVFGAARDRDNPLFKGFDPPDPDTAERADQPVLVRLGTADADELRAGFPQAAADLFRYHAVILDDVEAGFFTRDQLALVRDFVSRRGGGFLMLGGPDTFAAGRYADTPVGDLLPVYADPPAGPPAADPAYRLVLTREGWLQPWVRTRTTEADENRRLADMPAFRSLSPAGRPKPGAAVLARVQGHDGDTLPALAVQPFGKGRSAALLIGDLWRWGLRRPTPAADDFDRAWRQTVRWLVADVPGRVEVEIVPAAGGAAPAVDLAVRAADPEFRPLDNAAVSVAVTRPDKSTVAVTAEPAGQEAGRYTARFVPREPGAYRAVVTVAAADGAAVGKREVGWVTEPAADEFARPGPDLEYLKELAERTGGQVVPADGLDAFVDGLPARGAPATETWSTPLWHTPAYFLLVMACLAAEWGLRRTNGLA